MSSELQFADNPAVDFREFDDSVVPVLLGSMPWHPLNLFVRGFADRVPGRWHGGGTE